MNKQLFSTGFQCPLHLSFYHFLVTSIVMAIKSTPVIRPRLIYAGLVCGSSVILMNASLLYNSIGVYQLVKIIGTPLIISLQMLQGYAVPQIRSVPKMTSMLVTLTGVFLATVDEVSANPKGVLIGLLAIFVTSQCHIWQWSLQKEESMSADELTSSLMLWQALLALIGSMSIENESYLSLFYLPYSQTMLVVGTSIMAVGANLSSFYVVGLTSPLTYQILGHSKTATLLFVEVVAMGKPLSTKQALGSISAFLGAIAYGMSGLGPKPT